MKWIRFFSHYPLLSIGLFLALLLIPFWNKAVHNDDALYVWCAENIIKHPLDFYGPLGSFNVNWGGTTVPMAATNLNPPGWPYYLAGFIAFFGVHEIPMHLAMWFLTFMAAVGIYQLARLWCDRPLLATFVSISTPVFLVCATTLMCDMPALALWIWAVVFWEMALKDVGWIGYLAAGILVGMAILTKYSVFTLLPLLIILAVLRKKWVPLCWLIIPLAMIEAYKFWTLQLYGHDLIAFARHSAAHNRFLMIDNPITKIIVGMAYFGACLFSISVLSLAVLWKPKFKPLFAAIFIGCLVLALCVTGFEYTFNASFPMQMGAYIGGAFLILWASGVNLLEQRDVISVTLVCWIGSVFLFASVLNWTIAARSFLPMVPAAAILVVRLAKGSRNFTWPVYISAVVSLLIILADTSLANSGRTAAKLLGGHYPSAWYQSHSGFQFYLSQTAIPVEFGSSTLSPGDIMIMPENGSNTQWPPNDVADTEAMVEFSNFPGVSTISGDTGAGFYGVGFGGSAGALPFVFGPKKSERYFIFRFNQQYVFPRPGYQSHDRQ